MMMMMMMIVWCLIFDVWRRLKTQQTQFSNLDHGTDPHISTYDSPNRHCCRGRKLSIHWQVPHGTESLGVNCWNMLKWNAKRFLVFTVWIFDDFWDSNQLNASRQLEEALRRLDSRVERVSATALQSSEGPVPVGSVWVESWNLLKMQPTRPWLKSCEVSSWTLGKKQSNWSLIHQKVRKNTSNNMLQEFHGIL